MNGADVIARTLRELGIDTLFCYPGGANLAILDALSRVAITLVRSEHEQGAVFAAQGYARASGRLGVCLATSGPGATNLVTGIADANSDSIPVLAITGNVATSWLGRNAFQEVDIVAVTTPITKHALQVRRVIDIHRSLTQGASIALASRPGPVLLDFPKDVQQAALDSDHTSCCTADPNPADSHCAVLSADESAGTTTPGAHRVDSAALTAERVRGIDGPALVKLADLLAASRRPVIYAGGGIVASGTSPQLTRFAEALGCPVVLTLMGLGVMPANHPLLLGPVGMHGAYCANVAVNEADLVLALGVRFDDRVIGDPAAFARGATIVHIDIDARELGKNRPVHLGINADLRDAMEELVAIAAPLACQSWLEYLRAIAREHPLSALPSAGRLSGAQAISLLARRLPADAIVTTGVGQHQMWAMQFLKPNRARSVLSSAGFGTMGFGLPAAIGAKAARPDALVVDIDGDGSLSMTINELSTCRRHRLGVKVMVVNNQSLGMVRQWQDMIYARNRVASSLSDAHSAEPCVPYPDFVAIAGGYRIRAERVEDISSLDEALVRMLANIDEPYLLDVIVEPESDVYPMIPAGRTYRDVVFGSGANPRSARGGCAAM